MAQPYAEPNKIKLNKPLNKYFLPKNVSLNIPDVIQQRNAQGREKSKAYNQGLFKMFCFWKKDLVFAITTLRKNMDNIPAIMKNVLLKIYRV